MECKEKDVVVGMGGCLLQTELLFNQYIAGVGVSERLQWDGL